MTTRYRYESTMRIAEGAVGARHLANGSVSADKISGGAVGADKLAESASTCVEHADALRSRSGPSDNVTVTLAGRSSRGDGGGGSFFWDSASTDDDDGALTIAPESGDGRWKRIYSGPLDVRWFGAKGDGVTDDTAAVIAARSASGYSRKVYFPEGRYLIDPEALASTAQLPTLHIVGDGKFRSILKARVSGAHVIEVTGVNSLFGLTIENIGIEGHGALTGSGHGIYVHDNVAVPQGIVIRNVWINGVGGSGIFIDDSFFTLIECVDVYESGGHSFDIFGDNTCTLISCYAHLLPVAGTCGFRIHSGFPTLIGCNGIDVNAGSNDWGVFGDNIDDDGSAGYCRPTFIGCNAEDFSRYGMRFKINSWGGFHATTLIAPVAGTVTALTFDFVPGTGGAVFDAGSVIATKGAAWTSGEKVHCTGGSHPPFVSMNTDATGGVSTYFHDGASSALPSSTATWLSGTGTAAQTMNAINVPGPIQRGTLRDGGFMSAAPTTGSWSKGDIVWNDGTVTNLATVSYWRCTVAGAPGTWAGYT